MGVKTSKDTHESKQEKPMMTYQNMVRTVKEHKVQTQYQFLQKIGTGSYAQVFRAKSKKTGNIRAIKKIDKSKNTKTSHMLINESDVLKKCDHPNIIKLYQLFEDYKFFFMVSELCHGTELYDTIKEVKYFSESQACQIFYQIVSAIAYMHQIGVMHRDLKPENMMYDSESKIIKLIDFGTALWFDNSELMDRRCVGTAYYVAPQVLKKKYNQKCDVWSLGVILYILLCGRPPFTGKTDEQIMKNILDNELTFTRPEWKHISETAKNLIKKMLTRSVSERISMKQLMNEIWFKQNLKDNFMTQDAHYVIKCLKNMKKFQAMKSNKIQEGMLIFIVSFIKGTQDDNILYKCFKKIDTNGDGVISRLELKQAMKFYLKMNEKDASSLSQAVFDKVDFDQSDSIDYSEFIISAIDIELAVTQRNLDIAFDYIDSDNSGTLDIGQIRMKLGQDIDESVYKKMVKDFDSNGDGQIDRKQFKKMMMKLLNQSKSSKR